jgi:RNA polymerase sigma factor (sigma-70 family)
MQLVSVNPLLRTLRRLVAGRKADGLSDQRLVEQYLADRDEGAFAALLERHGRMVLGVCRRVLHDEQLAEDAFQATFLVLARQVRSIRKRGSLASWLHGVAFRLAHKARARAARARRPDTRNVARPPTEPLADVTWREAQTILDEELHRLPETYRSALVLCYLQGRTRDEAAEQLGWSPAQLKGRLDRGRERLRRCLIRRGVGLPTIATILFAADTASATVVPPLLTVATTRAALHLAAGKTLGTCGLSFLVMELAKTRVGLLGWKQAGPFLLLLLLSGMLVGTWAWLNGGASNAPSQANLSQERTDDAPPVQEQLAGWAGIGKTPVHQPDSATLVKWNLEPGNDFQLVFQTETEQTVRSTGKPVAKNKIVRKTFVSYYPQGRKGNSWSVTQKIDRIIWTVEVSGQKYVIDTAATKPVDTVPFRMLRAQVGRQQEILVDDQFRVEPSLASKCRAGEAGGPDAVPGGPDNAADRWPPDSPSPGGLLAWPSTSFFNVVPSHPVKKGEMWEGVSTKDLGPVGSLKQTNQYVYDGNEGHLHRIKNQPVFSLVPTGPEFKNPFTFRVKRSDLRSAKGHGTIWFDNQRGILHQSEMEINLEAVIITENTVGQRSEIELTQVQKTTIRSNPS